MKRDLGKAGESKFVSWCHDVGITINKAEEDKHGWDFLLELPVNRTSGAAFDLHKSNMICKVQVKSTEGKKLSKAVELSNLHALATDPLPAFYLFLHYSSDSTPSAAYLLHLDSSLIKRTLKAARNHISAGEGDKLHKKTLTLNYNETHKLLQTSGAGLLSHLEKNHYKSWNNLIVEKQKTLSTAGFEDSFGDLQFTIKGSEQRDNLILSSLGYNKKINISDFSLWFKRFGIKDKHPTISLKDGVMSMTKSDFFKTRVMITCLTAETLVLPAKIYFSHFSSSPEEAIFRISTDYFDVHANSETRSVKLNSVINNEKYYPANLLRKALIFIEHSINTQQKACFYFEHQGEFHKFFSISTNCPTGTIERLSLISDELRNIFKESFDFSSISTSPYWLRQNSNTILEISDLKCNLGSFKITLENAKQMSISNLKYAYFFLHRILKINSISYIFIFVAQCHISHENHEKYDFSGIFKLAKEIEGPNSEPWINETLTSIRAQLTKDLVKAGDVYYDEYLPNSSPEINFLKIKNSEKT